MQKAEVVLGVLRERGRKGLPFTQLYRQMFNKDLYLLAYGNIYSNQGAMAPGANAETADGMSEEILNVLSRVDGEMTAREVLQVTPFSPEEAEKSLFCLLCTGVLEYTAAEAAHRAALSLLSQIQVAKKVAVAA